jgi:hypothetical protein
MEQGWANGQEWFENIPYAGQLFGEDEEGRSYTQPVNSILHHCSQAWQKTAPGSII